MLIGFVSLVEARVVRVEITSRKDVLGGQSFGNGGAYERITGRVYFSVAVANKHNDGIVDLENAVNLKRMMSAHHGVLIVTPEYNSSVPALVKNTIDWVTRVQDAHETRGQVLRERAFAIAAASESRLGGTRSLAALRLILSACHASVIPNQLALSFADQAYDDMDRLKHPADIEALNALVRQLIDVSQRMM